MYKVWQVEQTIDALSLEINEKTLHLDSLQVQIKNVETHLKLEVSSDTEVTYEDLVALKAELEELLNTTVRLDVTPRISL